MTDAWSKPTTVEAVSTTLKRQHAIAANKTSIYRELQFLVREHVLREVILRGRSMYYEAAHLPHHHHAVCTSCDRIEDIPVSGGMSNHEQKIPRPKKFKVFDHSLEVYGLCRHCQ